MADCRAFLSSTAMRRLEKVSSARAASADLPRIDCATRLSFCALVRSLRSTERDSTSDRPPGCFGLPIDLAPLGLLIRRAPVQGARQTDLAEPVTHPVPRDHNRPELLDLLNT